jgi:heme/copper-type cytochrome/quinol oxidase subunit 2
MDQAIILFGGFTVTVIVIGIIGIIYYFYDEKKQKKEYTSQII